MDSISFRSDQEDAALLARILNGDLIVQIGQGDSVCQIVVEQQHGSQSNFDGLDSLAGNGRVMWDAGLYLAHWLYVDGWNECVQWIKRNETLHVMELGCGAAPLPCIAIAHSPTWQNGVHGMGVEWTCVATDGDDVALECAQRNMDRHIQNHPHKMDSLTVAPLIWGDSENMGNKAPRSVDILLGADIIHFAECHDALVQTLCAHAHSASLFICAWRHRTADSEARFFGELLPQHGWTCAQWYMVDDDTRTVIVQGTDLGVVRTKAKRNQTEKSENESENEINPGGLFIAIFVYKPL